MDEHLKNVLEVESVHLVGTTRGGVVNNSAVYQTDDGTKYFAKFNTNPETKSMFIGERESLLAIASTKVIKVPRLIKLVDHPSGQGAVSILEHFENLQRISAPQYWTQLGDKIGRLHRYNIDLLKNRSSSSVHKDDNHLPVVEKFGFHCETFLGRFTPGIGWYSSWQDYFARAILKPVFTIIDWEFHDQEVRELWSELQLYLDKYFQGAEILPALLHGDLCTVNVGHVGEEVVTYDPACMYGDPEFDFGQIHTEEFKTKFDPKFFEAYRQHIPENATTKNRQKLYYLFTLAIYWIHGNTRCREGVIECMKELIDIRKTLKTDS